jgi:hypothetical protein
LNAVVPMKKRKRKLVHRLWRGQRGQSMISYAVITAAILGGLTVMSMYILPQMLEALDNFTASLYFGINLPLP